jgi:hypothetical protein
VATKSAFTNAHFSAGEYLIAVMKLIHIIEKSMPNFDIYDSVFAPHG